MNPIAKAYWIAKTVGWENVPRRLLQEWRIRTGLLRKRLDPKRYTDQAFQAEYSVSIDEQPDIWRQRAERFFTTPSAESLKQVVHDALWNQEVIAVCERALAGEYPFFSHWIGQLGWPPDFNRDPINQIDWPVGDHWIGTAKSGPPRHDIKLVWEPSRFTLAFHLCRAYARDRDEKWAEAFWQMFEAWVEQNPPQLTVAWGCGQEITFRMMAMLSATLAMLESASTTHQRLYTLTRLCWQFAHRIEANINYAQSQKNNHGISEALGLWTVGLLFPDFSRAAHWRERGREILVKECERQIYDDGSFVQHSLNYHRVMLDDLMWAIRLAQINDRPLPDTLVDRFRRATDWLGEMVDPISGRAPNYGSNDGANVLPLACCDYLDYRPTLQAAHSIANQKTCLEDGPWNEKALWLCGEEVVSGKPEPIKLEPTWSAPVGGYYVLRGPNSWLMTRCGKYRDRPHQCDMLHVDLWYRGHYILRDAGSYMYYHHDERLHHYFHSTAAHNTVQVGNREQMTKGPRFMWFHWPRGEVLGQRDTIDQRESTIEFSSQCHHKTRPLVICQRSIHRVGDSYMITDYIRSHARQEVCLRWRLADIDWQEAGRSRHCWMTNLNSQLLAIEIDSDTAGDIQLFESNDPQSQCYESLYYGEYHHSPMLMACLRVESSARITTTIRCGEPNGSLSSS